jgi:hypothetical protein
VIHRLIDIPHKLDGHAVGLEVPASSRHVVELLPPERTRVVGDRTLHGETTVGTNREGHRGSQEGELYRDQKGCARPRTRH